MKILHITDLHFFKPYFIWVTENQNKFDAICITGDILNNHINCKSSYSEQIDWINEWVKSVTKSLLICSGNHDEYYDVESETLEELFTINNDDSDIIEYSHQNSHINWIKNLNNKDITTDGKKTIINNLKFGCIPYGEDNFSQYSDCDVILYHIPPSISGTACEANRNLGCNFIAQALKEKTIQPQWILSGHIHQPSKKFDQIMQTKISNPGSSFKLKVPHHHEIKISKP